MLATELRHSLHLLRTGILEDSKSLISSALGKDRHRAMGNEDYTTAVRAPAYSQRVLYEASQIT